MATTQPSSLSTTTLAALRDELIKIGAAKAEREKKLRLKKWLKNTLLIAGGSAAGTGISMAGDRILKKALGKAWARTHPKTRLAIAIPLASAAGAASMAAGKKMMTERRRRDRE